MRQLYVRREVNTDPCILNTRAKTWPSTAAKAAADAGRAARRPRRSARRSSPRLPRHRHRNLFGSIGSAVCDECLYGGRVEATLRPKTLGHPREARYTSLYRALCATMGAAIAQLAVMRSFLTVCPTQSRQYKRSRGTPPRPNRVLVFAEIPGLLSVTAQIAKTLYYAQDTGF